MKYEVIRKEVGDNYYEHPSEEVLTNDIYEQQFRGIVCLVSKPVV